VATGSSAVITERNILLYWEKDDPCDPRRGHQRGAAAAAREARVRATVQQQPHHLQPSRGRVCHLVPNLH
jgi:hypothetical protein